MDRVYISSTYDDLKEHRDRVMEYLRGMQVDYRNTMEDGRARHEKTLAACLQDVDECAAYIGIFAHRYGWIPEDTADNPQRLSMTELEYRRAYGAGIPCLIFTLDTSYPWPPPFIDSNNPENDAQRRDGAEKLARLKRERLSRHTPQPFTTPEDLARRVQQALHILLKGAGETAGATWSPDRCPYPGLHAFEPEDHPVYFGRERQVEEVLEKLADPACAFLIVSGASGSGKSSLIKAGVLPRLIGEEGGYLYMRPGEDGEGSDPFKVLAYAVKALLPGSPRSGELAEAWRRGPGALAQTLADSAAPSWLVLDQMEELYTHCPEPTQVPFLDALFAAIRAGRLKVIASIRSDFLDACQTHEGLHQVLESRREVRLWSLGRTAIVDMIRKPAQVAGLEVDEVADALARETMEEPGNLPLLAAALRRLWEERAGSELTPEAYQRFGGIRGVVGEKADQAFGELAAGLGVERADAAFHHAFSELVRVDVDGRATRKVAELHEFQRDGDALRLVEMFCREDNRLLVRDCRGHTATVQVSHEALFGAWPKLSQWIEARRNEERELALAESAGREWAQSGYDLTRLWHHSRILAAREAMARLERSKSRLPDAARELLYPEQRLCAMLQQPLGEVDHRRRAAIGERLDGLGDPRPEIGVSKDGLPAFDEDYWIPVPGGTVTLDLEEGKTLDLRVEPLRIARLPVTQLQLQAFIDAEDGYRNPAWWPEFGDVPPEPFVYPPEGRNLPATQCAWFEALAYARWLTARLRDGGGLPQGRVARLPTEQEWQQAACSGNPANTYPWGREWGEGPANTVEGFIGRTCAVGLFPQGATPREGDRAPGGVLDMAGNVWEWCLNKHDDPLDLANDSGEAERVLRGGAWFNLPDYARVAYRSGDRPGARYGLVGFRLCVSSPIEGY